MVSAFFSLIDWGVFEAARHSLRQAIPLSKSESKIEAVIDTQ
jgi:hypothetical protein